MKIRYKKDIKSEDQLQRLNKFQAVESLAREAGFDNDTIDSTEFCLMPFFERIVEECAIVAEQQSMHYSDGNQSTGCKDAANAIRAFKDKIGNYPARTFSIGPVKNL